MRVEALQETTFAKDVDGKLLKPGDQAVVDPGLGNAWACMGIVRVIEHDKPAADALRMTPAPPEPEQAELDGHILTQDRDGNVVRDYMAERRLRAAKPTRRSKLKPNRKEKHVHATDQS